MRWSWAAAPDPDLEALAGELAAGRRPGNAIALKSSDRRDVWGLPATAGGVIVKHFRVRGAEAFKFLWRPSRARAEFRAMQAFERLGLPSVRALGFGERRSGPWLREAWFVGRLVPHARTLGAAQQAAADAGDEERVVSLLRKALDVTASLHRHPWLHRDLHAHNLLLTADDEVLIMDLHSAWRVPRLTHSMRLGNLARLLFSMRANLDLDSVPPLLRRYAEQRGEDGDELVLGALAALAGFERRYVHGRTMRCLKRSSLFTVDRVHDGRLFRRRNYEAAQLREDLLAHQRSVQQRLSDLLARSEGSEVTRVPGTGGGRVIKLSTRRGLLPMLRQRLGLGRTRSAWSAARRLEVLGLATPQGLALLERHDGSAVLVTREVAGARSLRGMLDAQEPPDPAERRLLAIDVGHVVGRLDRAGLRHHDLSTKNVLVTNASAPRSGDRRTEPDPDWPRVWLIDLDNLHVGRPFAARGLARMLGQLGDVPGWVTRTDRLRFARGYARAAGRALPRGVVTAAAAASAARAARRARLPRPANRPGASIPPSSSRASGASA